MIYGFGYNRSTLRGLRKFESALTFDEKEAGLKEFEGDDGTDGVKATIGPQCMKVRFVRIL